MQRFDRVRAEFAVPASIGNVGPGFDALSVAVALFMRVRVVNVDPSTPDRLETEIAGVDLQGENRVERAFKLARERVGVPTPGVRVRVATDIPICAGLGSSAAATIAGLKLYDALTSSLSVDDMLSLGSDLEGHPDNVAACVLGGLAVSCRLDDGRVIARSSPWPAHLRFVIATPATALATNEARAVLPRTVALADAVFNLQRALLLVRAIENGQFDDLREAFRDRWHQPARSALVPGLREALAIDHPAVLGVCLSGAGPSIVALAVPGRENEAASILEDVYRRIPLAATIRILAAHQPVGPVTALALGRENTA